MIPFITKGMSGCQALNYTRLVCVCGGWGGGGGRRRWKGQGGEGKAAFTWNSNQFRGHGISLVFF